jgi:hypothetical protein
MPYRMRVRKFLNLPGFHAGAYVFAEVEDSTNAKRSDQDGWPWVEITLKLADCDRVVSFDFEFETARDRRNSLRKIDILVDTLTSFREALYQEAAVAEERAEQDRRNPSSHAGAGGAHERALV